MKKEKLFPYSYVIGISLKAVTRKKNSATCFLFAIDQLFIWVNSEEINQKTGHRPVKGTRKLGGFQQKMIEIIIKLGHLRNQGKGRDVSIMLK